MARCGIDLCLAGHLHTGYSGDVRTFHEGVNRSIISVQAGTGTSTRRRHDPNGYNRITIDRDHVTIQIRAWSDGRFDDAGRSGFRRRGRMDSRRLKRASRRMQQPWMATQFQLPFVAPGRRMLILLKGVWEVKDATVIDMKKVVG